MAKYNYYYNKNVGNLNKHYNSTAYPFKKQIVIRNCDLWWPEYYNDPKSTNKKIKIIDLTTITAEDVKKSMFSYVFTFFIMCHKTKCFIVW